MPGGIGVQLPGVNMLGATASTEVLCLLNMVTEEELRDDEEYEGRKNENFDHSMRETIPCF